MKKLDPDDIHTLVALAALTLLGGGAWSAWGVDYAALLIGGLLLSGVIYARTR